MPGSVASGTTYILLNKHSGMHLPKVRLNEHPDNILFFLLFFFQSFSLAKKKIVHYTTMDAQKRVNAAFLIASYVVSRVLSYNFCVL
jgi:hypothetical protein